MAEGVSEGELLLLVGLVVVRDEAVAELIPLAVSRQFVTTLCVRPSADLFAKFIQLMNELNSFLVNVFELGVVVAEEEEEEEPPRVINPPLLLELLLFFETANAV
jgi:hypothetical protein